MSIPSKLLSAVLLASCTLMAAEPKWEAARVIWQKTLDGSVGTNADGGILITVPITNMPAPPATVPDPPGGVPTATTYLRVAVGDFVYEWQETGAKRIVAREGDLLKFYRDQKDTKKVIVFDDRDQKHEFREVGVVPKLP